MTTLKLFVYVKTYLCLAVKTFSRSTYHVYIRVNRKFILRKKHVSFSLSLELAGIEHMVQAGMFVSQIFKSQFDQSLSFSSLFLPIDRPSKSDQTAWMGTHVNLYLFLDTGSNIIVGFYYCVHVHLTTLISVHI